MEITFSLLETTLAMVDALEYLPKFKKSGITSAVLPLLTEQDLIIIGIHDEQLRNRLLKQCSTLPFSSDSRLNTTLNEKALMIMLNEIDYHLVLLDASLTYALKRKDTHRCDVKLSKASNSLAICADSFEKEFRKFRHSITGVTTKTSNNRWKIALLTFVSATATVFVLKKFFTSL